MTGLYVQFINWVKGLNSERGDFAFGGSSLLWVLVAILIIVCLVVWLVINVDFNTKDDVAAILW